jgi:hypothetical protein
MSTTLEIGLDIGFTLDDPIKGVLDSPDYPIEGIAFTDITSRLDSMTIGRGKNRELDRFNSGTLTASLRNEDRAFDPLYAASPFFGDIIPRRRVRVKTDGEFQFEGVIDDWNFDYDPSGQSRAELIATDAFTYFSRQQLVAGTATTQTSGARVSAVLDMDGIEWPEDKRNIDDGVSVLGEDVFEGNSLDYLQKVSTSEQGLFFIGKDGKAVFRSRLDATPTSTSVVDFADDGTGIPYALTAVNYGTELMVNQAVVKSNAGTATQTDVDSASLYGTIATELDTLVNSVEQLENLAAYTIARFAEPEYRFGAIQVNLDTLGASDKADVIGVEIGDVLRITFTPNDLPPALVQLGQVINIGHRVTSSRHDIVFSLAAVDFTFLVLDDTEFGKLDSGNLLAF